MALKRRHITNARETAAFLNSPTGFLPSESQCARGSAVHERRECELCCFALCYRQGRPLLCPAPLCKVHPFFSQRPLCSFWMNCYFKKQATLQEYKLERSPDKSTGCPSSFIFPADTINSLKNDLTVPFGG